MKSKSLVQFATILLVVLVSVLLITSVASACPGCKDAIDEADPTGAQVARGYFWSILFMMSMPFALLGTFGAYCYLEVRRARADKEFLDQRER